MGDIANVKFGFKDPEYVVRHIGVPTIVLNAVREPGSNVLVVVKKLQEALTELNDGLLKEKNLRIVKVYDETSYIYSAIKLVRENIFVGGSLAILVLIIFLRNFASTVIVSIAIPISTIGTFVITSYSIHYTKLYEGAARVAAVGRGAAMLSTAMPRATSSAPRAPTYVPSSLSI